MPHMEGVGNAMCTQKCVCVCVCVKVFASFVWFLWFMTKCRGTVCQLTVNCSYNHSSTTCRIGSQFLSAISE